MSGFDPVIVYLASVMLGRTGCYAGSVQLFLSPSSEAAA